MNILNTKVNELTYSEFLKQLEKTLDNFMESIHVTDIKYSCYCDKGIVYHSALVLYEVVNI